MGRTGSPPQLKKSPMEGSNSVNAMSVATNANPACSSPITLTSSATSISSPLQLGRSSSALSLQSGNSTTNLLHNHMETLKNNGHSHYHSLQQAHHYHQPHHQQHHYHHHQGHQHSGRTSLTPSMKRSKKNWGSRERSGMSFLIVIAFFAVFGLIILTEVFMIDERSHNGMLTLRQGTNLGSRLGDSMPDYDNVKDDYDLLDDSFLSDNKLGFIQFRDNKLKIQEAGDSGRYAGILFNGAVGGYGGGGAAAGLGVNAPLIPWGQVLPTKVEETLSHFPFGIQPNDGSWQIVNGTRFKFFVFSAYYDRRDGARLVRIVGATKTRAPERVWCRFWYGQRNVTEVNEHQRAKYTSATVMARVKIIRENWNLKYSACFVLCPVRAPQLEVPQYVSIVSRLRAPPGNLLQLRNTDWDVDFMPSSLYNSTMTAARAITPPTGDNIPDKLAVCVKPFHFNYDQALYLVEYLEFYALLGVSHFTFYNHTMGPHASCVLRHYIDGNVPGNLTAYDMAERNAAAAIEQRTSANTSNTQQKVFKSMHYTRPTVTILPWNLRMRSQKEIRTEGLFAALNDCLYRTMYRYKYLALVDLDEFIVPRYTDTLRELIRSLNQRFRNRNTGAYSFQNAFFYLQFADDTLATTMKAEDNIEMARVRASLVTQRKTRRRYKLHPQKQRSKYICKPEAVVEAGNHFVWEFAPGKGSLNVPPKEAILQHYRVCEFGGNDCIKAPSIVDRTTNKYVNRLVQRVDAVYRHLRQACDLAPLPVLPKQVQYAQHKMDNENSMLQADKMAKKEKEQRQQQQQRKNKIKPILKFKNQKNATTKDETTIAITTTTTVTTAIKVPSLKSKAAGNGNGNRNVNRNGNGNGDGSGNTQQEMITTRVRKKRKVVVIEANEFGAPVAHLEYL